MSSTKVIFAGVILYHTILGNKHLFQNGRALLKCRILSSYSTRICRDAGNCKASNIRKESNNSNASNMRDGSNNRDSINRETLGTKWNPGMPAIAGMQATAVTIATSNSRNESSNRSAKTAKQFKSMTCHFLNQELGRMHWKIISEKSIEKSILPEHFRYGMGQQYSVVKCPYHWINSKPGISCQINVKLNQELGRMH
jgi:hypothetical protein